jgi:hypothetical protein
MGQYTLWCLNRVARWNRRKLADALELQRWFGAGRHRVRLGSRAGYDKDPAWENSEDDDPTRRGGILMHEDRGCDEYFVPIAVKCIGDPLAFRQRFQGAFTPAGEAAFNGLLGRYRAYFGSDAWRSYWEPFPISSALSDVGMFTRTSGDRAYAGLYELVADDAARSNSKAVLVGYSQGGLVARVLAWMDEMFMAQNRRSIVGIITVQSPNHGSPLASRCNARNAAVGLLGILTALGGFPVVDKQSPNTRTALEALVGGTLKPPTQWQGVDSPRRPRGERHPPARGAADDIPTECLPPTSDWYFDAGTVCRVLDAFLEDPAAGDGKADVFRTARKWLTGIAPMAVATAFDDLDPRHLDDPHSVLGCLLDRPHRDVLHAAIIGRDTRFDDLVLSGACWIVRHLHRLIHRLGSRWFTPVEKAYGRVTFDEAQNALPKRRLHRQMAGLYQSGTRIVGAESPLPAFAHDFVIPSVSQALYPLPELTPTAGFLRNVVNPRATHLSGAGETGLASDRRLVVDLLGELGRQLP